MRIFETGPQLQDDHCACGETKSGLYTQTWHASSRGHDAYMVPPSCTAGVSSSHRCSDCVDAWAVGANEKNHGHYRILGRRAQKQRICSTKHRNQELKQSVRHQCWRHTAIVANIGARQDDMPHWAERDGRQSTQGAEKKQLLGQDNRRPPVLKSLCERTDSSVELFKRLVCVQAEGKQS